MLPNHGPRMKTIRPGLVHFSEMCNIVCHGTWNVHIYDMCGQSNYREIKISSERIEDLPHAERRIRRFR